MQLVVKHNIEVAHRLSLTPGKCQNIHGHSMQVEVHLHGELIDETGKMDGHEIGVIKDAIRNHLNEEYDHHLLLNVDDPWANVISVGLPGLKKRQGDPTTENIARWICQELLLMLPPFNAIQVVINETATNSVVYP